MTILKLKHLDSLKKYKAHTVYITMCTYSIHYYVYIQYTLLCIPTVYTQCACFYTCRHALCVCNNSISTQDSAECIHVYSTVCVLLASLLLQAVLWL